MIFLQPPTYILLELRIILISLIIYKPSTLIISPQTFSIQLGAGTSLFCLSQCAIPFCTFSALTSSIFPPNTWGFATSTLLPYWWRSMVLTYCCRVAIMVRSCSSLVGGSCWREVGARDISPYCYCCCYCCWQDISYDGSGSDSNGNDLYLELFDKTSSSRATI